ncbi:hypothetical protein HK101_011809 [Irineochytrium annulatum]|nr:hypothetical protein HK101_011809 [Irineochytrium annulatum]
MINASANIARSSTKTGVGLAPELWQQIVLLASSNLADLARLSTLSRVPRELSWSTCAARHRFIVMAASRISSRTSEGDPIEVLHHQLEDVRDLRRFPDLPGLLSVFHQSGPVRCGSRLHSRSKCLVIRVCEVVDDDAWVSACLKPLSGDVVTDHRGAAFRVLVHQGRVDLIPILIDGREGNAVTVAINAGYVSARDPIDPERILRQAVDPRRVFELCYRHWGFAISAARRANVIVEAACKGQRDVATLLLEASDDGNGRRLARELALRVWATICRGQDGGPVNLDTVQFLIDIGASPESWSFVMTMHRHEVLPDRIEDDPLLLLMSTSATYTPQLIDLGVFADSYLDVCLISCVPPYKRLASDAASEELQRLAMSSGAPRKSATLDGDAVVEYAKRALDLGARVSSRTFAIGVFRGHTNFLRLISSHMGVNMVKDDSVVECFGYDGSALVLEACELVLDLGFPVRQTRSRWWREATGARDKESILAALVKNFRSVIDASLLTRVLHEEPWDENARVFRQVQMLLDFEFEGTQEAAIDALRRGFTQTALLISNSILVIEDRV